ncbi:MAG: tol-pal system protein YbgF [Porticoccus sp.]|nr:tol-pal system protein YbgF [Porticoccus sp.]
MSTSVYTAFLGLFITVSAFAAVPVSEIGGQTQQSVTVARPQAPAIEPDVSRGDVHYQVQLLQDEVRTLRGITEELDNEIRLLKKRQMDDYMDLDRRLSSRLSGVSGDASQPKGNESGAVIKGAAANENVQASTSSSQADEERVHYDNAYAQLKAGKVTEAVSQFKAHISKYPTGKYVANAHYWLGEIYVLQNNLELARQSFSTVVESFPAHRKAPDSIFKLGQVYFMLGNKVKSKALLEKAAAGNDNASRLARGYLDENF